MSVVRHGRRRRWLTVIVGAAVLVAGPASWSAVRSLASDDARPGGSPLQLADRIRAAADVAHQGLVESRGGVSLPDLPRLGPVSSLIGGTVRARVWWDSPTRWRVDSLTVTGEQGTYRANGDPANDGPANGAPANGTLVTWDYEDDTLITSPDPDALRLPRIDDLLPPRAAARLLGGVGGADRVEVRPGTARVAGRDAWGLRVLAGDGRGTLSSLEVWADARTDLPLAVTVRGTDGAVALETRFLTVSFERAHDDVLDPPSPPAARLTGSGRVDLVALSDRSGPWPQPPDLAGFPRAPAPADRPGGVATYGDGLTRFVVLPLSPGLGARVGAAVRTSGAARTSVAGGEIAEFRSGVLGLVLAAATGDGPSYLLSGPVRSDALRDAAAALLIRPSRQP